MITLNNVSAGYGGCDIIKNISLEIKKSLSIVGPNGCGKTTLLKAIAGILPSKGEIILKGKFLRDMSRSQISLSIAMLSQQPQIYFSYSIFDTVMMGRYLHIKQGFSNAPAKKDKLAVEEALKAVNLWGEKDKDISKLSGGQLQRVFLARTLAQEPSVILLDEPTNHLDLKCQIELIDYLKKWENKGNRLIIGVLHDINLALSLSPQVVVMENGEIHANADADQIIKDGVLDKIYHMNVRNHMINTLEKWRK